MREVQVSTPSGAYRVRIGGDILEGLADALRGYSAAVLVADDRVAAIHGPNVSRVLEAAGPPVHQWVVPAGESSKTLWQAEALYDFLASREIDRQAAMVPVGGGMITDLAGFVASTWMRGIGLHSCPTTLLAAVDASVGGKTGLNHGSRKNQIGTFYQPSGVWVDPAPLATLDDRQWRVGLAECVKHALIDERPYLDWLESRLADIRVREVGAVGELIARNVGTKARIVTRDVTDHLGIRARLNFGHTLGHAIEAAADYRLAHGECVAIGMVGAMWIAEQRFDAGGLDDLERVLGACGLDVRLPEGLDIDRVLMALRADKKSVGGGLRFVLPGADGRYSADHEVHGDLVLGSLGYLAS